MTTSARLDKAGKKLSAKQIVLLMLKEAHAASTPVGYVKRMLQEGAEGTICGKIERSIGGESRTGHSGYAAETTHAIREAQREGMFLWGLATRCCLAVVEAREAIDLRWLLWIQSLLTLGAWREWAEGTEWENTESPLTLERVGRELRRVRDVVLALKGAVELIETRYFGMHILFPSDREWL
jgi:hypothetical protein